MTKKAHTPVQREKITIDIPEDVMNDALSAGRKAIMIFRPNEFKDGAPLRLKARLSGRLYDLDSSSSQTFVLTTDFDKIKKILPEVGAEDMGYIRDLEDAYSRSDMYGDNRPRDNGFLFIKWRELKPVAGNCADPSVQQLSLGQGQFKTLFFIRGSEYFLAEKERRTPVSDRTGSIHAGDRDWTAGPVRLVETDGNQKPTGWENETAITNVWKGRLNKVPGKYAEAAGFSSQREAISGLFNLYARLGRPITKTSIVTAVLFEPAKKEKTGFRILNP